MLKYQKKMIDNYIKLLEQAHSAIYAKETENQTDEIMELLQNCQEWMIQIGGIVEKGIGEDFAGIHDMEAYCESLYMMAQSINVIEVYNKHKQTLNNIFKKILYQIHEVAVKKEVVFFPYNASMWDCMESIWIASDKDPDVEVYVVPIPYYERNSQGMAVTEKYEGKKFPPYVPITDYHMYNLEQHKPDIAYIHNPFDQFNNVASVHPDYYSYELKKNILKVVYVPYFITDGAVYFTHRDLPAYYHVDNIVVQSEKIIDSFAATIKRDKFLPVGNPIVDRIINLEKNKPEIPDSWKQMLPNGLDFAEKKVVMFNTSISMMMRERESFLDKIEYMINVFLENDEVIMVWRPHPLMHATLQAMGDELYSRFLRIEKMFLEKRVGVLDKTADVGIAVALCDAYIGEQASSLIHMFGVAGKPRFYLDLNINEECTAEDNCKVTSFSSFIENGTEFFVSEEYRCICKLDNNSKEAEVVARIPGTKRYPYGAYKDIYKYGNNIYLQPYSGQGIVIYNMNEDSFRKKYVKGSIQYGFCKMIPHNNALYFLPKKYPYVVKFDLDSEEFQYYSFDDVAVQTILQGVEPIEDKLIGRIRKISKRDICVIKVRELYERTGGSIIWENNENRLQDFLYYITTEGVYDKKKAQQSCGYLFSTIDGTCGEKIHKIMKASLS